MNVKRKIVVFAAACLFTFSQPLYVSADKCDDVMEKARKTFADATTASSQKEFAKAVKLYEEAEGYYKEASEMKNCRCPKIESVATKNISICRKNAANNKNALERQESYEAEVNVFETYNQAKEEYNQGTSYAKSQQWELAISAFEKAKELWESIAFTETENGRRAIEAVKLAQDSADLARQRMGQ